MRFKLNKEQRFFLIVFVVMTVPVLLMIIGNYGYVQGSLDIPGQQLVGLPELVLVIVVSCLVFFGFALYLMKDEMNKLGDEIK